MQEGALLFVKLEETILQDAGADLAHELVIKVDVMFAEQLPAERFRAFRQVMEIGARITGTGRAAAFGVELLLREPVNAAPHLQEPARGENSPALRELGRHDAVKHVHAAMDRLEQIERRAHAHEVARFVRGQQLGGEGADIFPFAFAFAHGQTADGVAVEGHLAEGGGAFAAKLGEERALHDAKKGLGRIAAGGEAAGGPAVGHLERLPRGRLVRGGGNALVERHHDVAADGFLGLDAHLRAEQDGFAVEIALEKRPLLAQRTRVRQ